MSPFINYTTGASLKSVSVSVPWNSSLSFNSIGPTPTTTLTRTSLPTSARGSSHGSLRAVARGDFPVQLATSRTRTTILADLSADLSDTRFFSSRGVGDARVYTCTCTVHKLSCTRLQNYTIGTSLKSVSVSVSVPWNSSFSHLQADCLYTGISSGPNARKRVGL